MRSLMCGAGGTLAMEFQLVFFACMHAAWSPTVLVIVEWRRDNDSLVHAMCRCGAFPFAAALPDLFWAVSHKHC